MQHNPTYFPASSTWWALSNMSMLGKRKVNSHYILLSKDEKKVQLVRVRACGKEKSERGKLKRLTRVDHSFKQQHPVVLCSVVEQQHFHSPFRLSLKNEDDGGGPSPIYTIQFPFLNKNQTVCLQRASLWDSIDFTNIRYQDPMKEKMTWFGRL